MSWVRRTERPVPAHACAPPMAERFITVPPSPPLPSGLGGGGKAQRVKVDEAPDGERNDLWRCDDCGRLWRIGYGDTSSSGSHRPPLVIYSAGPVWLPATLWQRWRNR